MASPRRRWRRWCGSSTGPSTSAARPHPGFASPTRPSAGTAACRSPTGSARCARFPARALGAWRRTVRMGGVIPTHVSGSWVLRSTFPGARVRRMGKVRRALATDDETRWELSAVAIVLSLMGLIALVLIGLWLGGVWTGLLIVGVPLTTITALFIWGD